MKKVILCVGFAALVAAFNCGFASPAHADAPTLFAQLRTQYDRGTLVDFTPLLGKIDSGRCFSADAPNAPIASALLANKEIADDGPLSTSQQTILTLGATAAQNLAANYFDAPTVTATDANLEQARLPLTLIDATTYQIRLANLTSMRLRAVGPTIVALGRSAYGDETAMCYYFKIH